MGVQDFPFAGLLRASVGAKWVNSVVFGVRRAGLSIKNEVRAQMNEPNLGGIACVSQVSGRDGVQFGGCTDSLSALSTAV